MTMQVAGVCGDDCVEDHRESCTVEKQRRCGRKC